MPRDLLEQIQAGMAEYSKGQKRIAAFLLTHYDQAAFMTASRLGAMAGVSESTVVRFAFELGLDGYPELQARLQELIRNRLTTVQRMEVSNHRLADANLLEKVLIQDIECIRRTLEEVNTEAFNHAVDRICAARCIYILGVRSSSVLAAFVGFYFNLIFENVRVIHTTSASEMYEQMMRICPQDVFIGISFPRYSKRTAEAARYARDKGACVVAVTDGQASPLARYADVLLLANSDMASFVDSLVAPLSLINALIVAVGLKNSEGVAATFSTLEGIWEQYNVYEKGEGQA